MTPSDWTLYHRALTHGSTGQPDYQRLEFLGDRILGLVIADMLYHRYKDEAEGRLSHRLNALVSGATCAEIARQIGLAPYIRLGKQARDDGAQQSDNVLGDVMEAVIGALYIDHGLEAARALISRHSLAPTAGATSPHPRVIMIRVLAHLVEPAMALLREIRCAWRTELWDMHTENPRIWSM